MLAVTPEHPIRHGTTNLNSPLLVTLGIEP